MVQAKHIVAILIAACLSGCGYAMLDTDTTASFNSSGRSSTTAAEWTKSAEAVSEPAPVVQPPATTPAASPDTSSAAADKSNKAALNSLFGRASPKARPLVPGPAVKAVAVASTGEAVTAVERPPAAAKATVEPPSVAPEKVTIEPRGRAYLFRGVAGLIYSRGMDQLADRINRAGVRATVDTYLVWRVVADNAIRDYRRDPQPVTLIGHSMGGDSAVAFAEYLNAANIPVSLLVTYDPTRVADSVPPNVERYINLYQSYNIMGGGDIVQGRHFHGHYASFNLKDHREIIHINIEKAVPIQEQLVTKIAEIAATPAGSEGEAVPVRFDVPPNSAIELWDSGLPVSAHEGDTLKALAATYHVPLWALTQVNRVSDHAPLTEGQRIIVPRHLVPTAMPSPVSSYAPTAR